MCSVSQVASQSAKLRAGQSALGEVKLHLVYETPAPTFSGLDGPHDGMLGGMEVFRGVLVLRRIAAADMAAFHAQSQVNPGVAGFQAFFAAASVRLHILDVAGVGAFLHGIIIPRLNAKYYFLNKSSKACRALEDGLGGPAKIFEGAVAAAAGMRIFI
jgi:hypothetical protein